MASETGRIIQREDTTTGERVIEFRTTNRDAERWIAARVCFERAARWLSGERVKPNDDELFALHGADVRGFCVECSVVCRRSEVQYEINGAEVCPSCAHNIIEGYRPAPRFVPAPPPAAGGET